jgi:hypothetical protein
LQFFVKHWSHPTDPGLLLRVAVAWAQLNSGVSYSIFQNVVSHLPHFESKWLRSVRDFLQLIQGTLRLDRPWIPELQRVNDSFIMDHVLECGNFNPKEIQRINYCRLYYQAVTVSDISNASGTSLCHTSGAVSPSTTVLIKQNLIGQLGGFGQKLWIYLQKMTITFLFLFGSGWFHLTVSVLFDRSISILSLTQFISPVQDTTSTIAVVSTTSLLSSLPTVSWFFPLPLILSL